MPRAIPGEQRLDIRDLRSGVPAGSRLCALPISIRWRCLWRAFLDGADTHWQSAVALGLAPAGTSRDKQNKVHEAIREGAKRFRYAFLYGAGATTAGRIIYDTVRAVRQIDSTNDLQRQFFGGSAHPSNATLTRVGGQALGRFMAATPGLQKLLRELGSTRTETWLAARTRWTPRPSASAAQRAQLHRHQLGSDHLQTLAGPDL